MMIGLFIALGIVVIGSGLIIREQLNRQDKRIDALLKFIKPETYRRIKNAEKDNYHGPKPEEPKDPVAEALARGGG